MLTLTKMLILTLIIIIVTFRINNVIVTFGILTIFIVNVIIIFIVTILWILLS